MRRLILFATLAVSSLQSTAYACDTWQTTASTLNVRSSASISGSVVDRLARNSQVAVCEKSGSWSKIGTGKWVSSNYLTATNCVAHKTTASTLNVRSSPGGSVVDTLATNSWVAVCQTSGGWSRIGQSRWVSSRYLETLAASPVNSNCKKYRVTASALNVRNQPSIAGSRVRTLSNNEQVTSCVQTVGWAKIGTNEWVSARYLKEVTESSSSGSSGVDKYEETLREIFGHEGKCQNWASDTGNYLNGKRGYTCAGITPSVGYNNRRTDFSYALSRCSAVSAERFVKCAYDLNKSKFIEGAAQVYRRDYFDAGGCKDLAQPAFYVCSDIAVNSGIGRSRQFLRELGPIGSDVKGYARRLNEKHRAFYKRIGRAGTSNHKFLQGWLNRAAARDRFIDNF